MRDVVLYAARLERWRDAAREAIAEFDGEIIASAGDRGGLSLLLAVPGALHRDALRSAIEREDGAPQLDFIFTVCDNAAGEVCPIWPGNPVIAHWGIPDPAAVEGEGQERAFIDAYSALQRRIRLLLALPLESLDELTLEGKLREIGETTEAEHVVG